MTWIFHSPSHPINSSPQPSIIFLPTSLSIPMLSHSFSFFISFFQGLFPHPLFFQYLLTLPHGCHSNPYSHFHHTLPPMPHFLLSFPTYISHSPLLSPPSPPYDSPSLPTPFKAQPQAAMLHTFDGVFQSPCNARKLLAMCCYPTCWNLSSRFWNISAIYYVIFKRFASL